MNNHELGPIVHVVADDWMVDKLFDEAFTNGAQNPTQWTEKKRRLVSEIIRASDRERGNRTQPHHITATSNTDGLNVSGCKLKNPGADSVFNPVVPDSAGLCTGCGKQSTNMDALTRKDGEPEAKGTHFVKPGPQTSMTDCAEVRGDVVGHVKYFYNRALSIARHHKYDGGLDWDSLYEGERASLVSDFTAHQQKALPEEEKVAAIIYQEICEVGIALDRDDARIAARALKDFMDKQ